MGQAESTDPSEISPECTTSFTPKPVSLDEEGFVPAFDLNDVEGYKAFWEEYGFVVIKDVLSEKEISDSIDELWNDIIESSKELDKRMKTFTPDSDETYIVNREDPSTWDLGWPSGGSQLGILGDDIASHKVAWMNRQNVKVYEVYANLLGTEKLVVSLDRYGAMRPIKNIPFPVKRKTKKQEETEGDSEEKEKEAEYVYRDRPEWQGAEKWFHWDLNPWDYDNPDAPKNGESEELQKEQWQHPQLFMSAFICENNSRNDFKGFEKVQGLIALSDSKEDTGGFITVPGFHKYMKTWASQTKQISRQGFISCPTNAPFLQYVQKITARKGSLIVWNSRMVHCNYPNEGSSFRYCQYLKMFPAEVMECDGSVWPYRIAALRNCLPPDLEITELGEKLFGLKPW